VIIQTILIILGSLIFMFAFWRRLKEDYFENQIFTTGFYILFFVFLANIFSWYFAQAYWFLLSFIGIFIGLGLSTLRYKMRFFENVEATVSASFIPIMLILLYDGIHSRHPEGFFGIAVIGLLIGIFYFLSTHYKRITWYKSGRIGFAGISVIGIFFLLRALLAVRFPNMISFVEYEWLISGSVSLLAFLTIIYLSRKVS
jgi:hypothetical protein